jgi:adenosylcobyric acid synthase
MRTPAIMVLGTGSHVGKSMLTTALCRILSQAGYRVAPFKAQNMSLNSAATPEGLEIGRAQALQAEAAGIPASVHMNPILLKPSGDASSQVIVRGKIWGHLTAEDYFRRRTEELVPVIRESYELLATQNDLMILEGAGSPAEINLKDRDIVNLRMAKMAGARCVLVGDIDRGGVFASLLGTLELLDPVERDQIDGFIINKFRGDISLLLPGVRAIEQRMRKPCLGVVPFLHGLTLDEEDSVSIEQRTSSMWTEDTSPHRPLRIAIICFPSIANFTDFDPLLAEPSVKVRFCRTAEEMEGVDLIILPGTKQTIADLRWMRASEMDHALLSHADRGAVLGICGGMQMLGSMIEDPYAVEGGGREEGLCLLPILTVMAQEKTTREAEGDLLHPQLFGQPISASTVRGYEIHVGQTEYLEAAEAFTRIRRTGSPDEVVLDGCVGQQGQAIGTYLHGIFHHDEFRHSFLSALRAASGLEQPQSLLHWKELRAQQFDRLADTVSTAVDLRTLLGWVGLPWPAERKQETLCASRP